MTSGRILRTLLVAVVLLVAPADAQDRGYLPPPLLGPPKPNAYGPA